MNKVFISGRISSISELKTAKETKYIMFSVAVRENKDTTYFFDCSALNGVAETISKYFSKGDQIIICGKLQQRKYKDSKLNNNTILVESFDFGAKKAASAEDKEESSELPFDVPV